MHLAGCEDAFIATVAYGLEGIQQASGLAQFLAEEVDGSLISTVGIVEHGKEAEVSTMSAGAARVVGWTGSCGAVAGSVCAFHGIESEV